MPLYDYICQHCERDFTELRKTSEMDSPITCSECGSIKTSRLLSCFSVVGTQSSKSVSGSSTKSQFR